MRFQPAGNDTRCDDCAFIQATGEIVEDTPQTFERFLKTAPEYAPKRVRLNSPGGSLRAGVALGELFRSKGFATEVGADAVDPEGHPAFGARASDRKPGVCASACAYAFLGGVERMLEPTSKLGVHRFYSQAAVDQPTEKLFTGQDVDAAQRLTAALVFYVMKMGADARFVSLAATAGHDEMRWLAPEEARELRATYEPRAWKPWRVEAYRGGALAITETNDGLKSIVASCTRRFGPQVVLTDKRTGWDVGEWFEQTRTCPFDGSHPVFDAKVDPSKVQVTRRAEGGAIMRFRLPTVSPPLTSPALLDRDATNAYPSACSSWDYGGSRENFEPAVRLALRNCFAD
jgi:hypothetical protein